VNTQPHKPIQLILVEDDDAEVAAIERACAEAGVNCQITRFPDGNEALAALNGSFGRNLLTRPYLILLDLDLPDGSGMAFLDALRADPKLRRSIVFTISSSLRDEDKAAAYDRRVAGYLVKDALDGNYATLCDLLDVYEKSIQFPLN
jgi:CheY-like chemotaxis protein